MSIALMVVSSLIFSIVTAISVVFGTDSVNLAFAAGAATCGICMTITSATATIVAEMKRRPQS